MKKITHAQFTKMICEVLSNESPWVIYHLLVEAGIDVCPDSNVMDIIKQIRAMPAK